MNIGDRVEIVKTDYNNSELGIGQTGRIVGITGKLFDVVMDNGFTAGEHTSANEWPFFASELKVIA